MRFLGGNAKTLMFVNISPADYNADETVTSLTSAPPPIKNTANKNAESGEAAAPWERPDAACDPADDEARRRRRCPAAPLSPGVDAAGDEAGPGCRGASHLVRPARGPLRAAAAPDGGPEDDDADSNAGGSSADEFFEGDDDRSETSDSDASEAARMAEEEVMFGSRFPDSPAALATTSKRRGAIATAGAPRSAAWTGPSSCPSASSPAPTTTRPCGAATTTGDVRPLVVHGASCFAVDAARSMRFDRIYVGAGARARDVPFFAELLKPGGVLVLAGPFEAPPPEDARSRRPQSLLKIVKTTCGRLDVEEVLPVQFTPLHRGDDPGPQLALRGPVWGRDDAAVFPPAFRAAAGTLARSGAALLPAHVWDTHVLACLPYDGARRPRARQAPDAARTTTAARATATRATTPPATTAAPRTRAAAAAAARPRASAR
ncbi:protein-L-isoaspartate (D-aspartate) O-methyltransferase [Aureococcus anophagefferens]|nr:protein-L-isoaspartate (D-aspartate) O-methyltransferase [Aureococcus anophagefferens]